MKEEDVEAIVAQQRKHHKIVGDATPLIGVIAQPWRSARHVAVYPLGMRNDDIGGGLGVTLSLLQGAVSGFALLCWLAWLPPRHIARPKAPARQAPIPWLGRNAADVSILPGRGVGCN